MGISNRFHFDWLKEAVSPSYDEILKSLPAQPSVLGLGEHEPNPLLKDLFRDTTFHYKACDLFPKSSETLQCDINDLSPLFNNVQADVICCFRTSYFLSDKRTFFEQIRHLLNSGSYLIMDFLLGSSDIPTIGFKWGDGTNAAIYDPSNPSFFKTTFYDDRLVDEFLGEVEQFCKHARNWPLRTRYVYFRRFPKHYFQDSRRLRSLQPYNLQDTMKSLCQPHRLVSLADFEEHGFSIVRFHARYFYPYVKKYNLYVLVVARFQG